MLILASQSLIRRQILSAAGLEFTTVTSTFDEALAKRQLSGKSPSEIAKALATGKAMTVSQANPAALVLGADQTLELNTETFDKPIDVPAARVHLKKLRGRTHHLHSALACVQNAEVLWQMVDIASLTMRNFSDNFLDDYLKLEGQDVCSSVGAYKLEGRGIHLFESIQGDHFTILGLPLLPLLSFLRQQGEVQT